MKIIFISFFLLLVNCRSDKIDSTIQRIDFSSKQIAIIEDAMHNIPIYIYVIDSCEYMGNFQGGASIFTHKGNCKFCQARKR